MIRRMMKSSLARKTSKALDAIIKAHKWREKKSSKENN
jgi:hypothetical protein